MLEVEGERDGVELLIATTMQPSPSHLATRTPRSDVTSRTIARNAESSRPAASSPNAAVKFVNPERSTKQNVRGTRMRNDGAPSSVGRRRRYVRPWRRRFTYTRWDGTQKRIRLRRRRSVRQITDDLVYHGDVNNALRRLLQQGFHDRNGGACQGIREMLERLRERATGATRAARAGRRLRRDRPGVREVVERSATPSEGRASGADAATAPAERPRTPPPSATATRHACPPDLAGQVRGLQNYDFNSAEAQQRFEQLMEQLREQLMQQMLNQMSDAMQNMSPEDMQRMKDMLAELNQMLDQRERGEEPDFEGFMEHYGDFFPENPQTLDELLEPWPSAWLRCRRC